jgi:hypothetical protein
MCVFKTKERRLRAVDILVPDCSVNITQIETATTIIGHGAHSHTTEGGSTAYFVPKDVRLISHDDFVAMICMSEHGNKIALGAGGSEECGLFAYYPRRHYLKPIDRGVLTINIVTYLRLKHCLPHRSRGMSNSVTTQVDYIHLTLPQKENP